MKLKHHINEFEEDYEVKVEYGEEMFAHFLLQ